MTRIVEKLKALMGNGRSETVPKPPSRFVPLVDSDSWAAVRATRLAFVFKHSPICHASARARLEVARFAAIHQDVPVFEVDVRADRDVSQLIANDLGIPHESPQIILLVDGRPRWHDSHWGIKLATLETALSADV